eukprot:scaffold12347_cov54-Cylindrotheca_fusiformis.AAC.2
MESIEGYLGNGRNAKRIELQPKKKILLFNGHHGTNAQHVGKPMVDGMKILYTTISVLRTGR